MRNSETSQKPIRKLVHWVVSSLLILFSIWGIGYLFNVLGYSPFHIPSFREVRDNYAVSEAVLFDRHHQILHEFRIDPRGRRLKWVNLGEISPALQSAVISAEDKRFYLHHGVDWKASGGALFSRLHSRNSRGASTISMQLVARLIPQLQPRDVHRSMEQKWKQMLAARKLEQSWSKAEILEAYLNLVSFRGELQGIASASQGLFNKRPHGLDAEESVILAALLRAPNAPAEEVARRASELIGTMSPALDGASVCRRTLDIMSAPYKIEPEIALAPHVSQQLFGSQNRLMKGKSVEAVCTLDRDLQRFTAETLLQHVLTVQGQNVHDAAALVVDNRTGEVLAYVGNIGPLSSARFVDGVQAKRQAGSTLKPFLYGLVFEKRILTPASFIDDAPLEVPASNGIYRPENYDRTFRGLVSARTALASSLNIPAVKVLNLVGVEAFVQKLGDLGIDHLQSADFYGSSLALGAADVTLWELVNAYRTLANGGLWSPLQLTFEGVPEIPTRRALPVDAAFLIADILSDRESRSETFHLESPLSTRYWTAVKTGTSKDMRDNWCVGFSDHFTVGVWAGNFSGEPMWNVTGITGAAPAWIEIMNWLHRGLPSHAPSPPAGVASRTVDYAEFGTSRPEWFLKGTETNRVQMASGETNFRIIYPAPGMVIALDPEIPTDQQKIFFESQPKNDRLHWVLDENEIGPAGQVLLWTPRKGRHTLVLKDEIDRPLDSVEFEVRGNLRAEETSEVSKAD